MNNIFTPVSVLNAIKIIHSGICLEEKLVSIWFVGWSVAVPLTSKRLFPLYFMNECMRITFISSTKSCVVTLKHKIILNSYTTPSKAKKKREEKKPKPEIEIESL